VAERRLHVLRNSFERLFGLGLRTGSLPLDRLGRLCTVILFQMSNGVRENVQENPDTWLAYGCFWFQISLKPREDAISLPGSNMVCTST
jgi:hypothetical protein